jgi:hypothetical protein
VKRYDRHSKLWRQLETIADPAVTANTGAAYRYITDWHGRHGQTADESWPALHRLLREPVVRLLKGDMGRAGKDGRPAYLAYAILAALLHMTPEKIRDFLGNYRHPRRRLAQ